MEQTPGRTADLVAFHWHIRKKSWKLICLAASTSEDLFIRRYTNVHIDWLIDSLDANKICSFYPRDAMLAQVFATATCPSVRHTPVLCENGTF